MRFWHGTALLYPPVLPLEERVSDKISLNHNVHIDGPDAFLWDSVNCFYFILRTSNVEEVSEPERYGATDVN